MELSIITINKNNKAGLEKTIQSVLEQTYPHIEQIIIDGGSTDGSIDVIKSFIDIPSKSYTPKPNLKNPFISYWVSKPDTGIYHAMNRGILQAKGHYCLFLNSGDYLADYDAVSNLFNYEPAADIVYTNQKRIGFKGERITIFPQKLTFYWLYTEYLPHNCTLFKRSIFDRIGLYSEDYRIVSDWFFYLKALVKEGCTYQYFDMVLSVMVDGGISNAPEFSENVKKERLEILKKEFPFFYEDYSDLYSYRYNHMLKKLKRVVKKVLNIRI